jgi:hypothetical protein
MFVHVSLVEEMCLISHMETHKASLVRILLLLRQFFLRVQHVVLCTKINCILQTKRLCHANSGSRRCKQSH